jgi:sucrose-6-phosphate hydrolase SacC (GH32 family)
LFRTPTIFATVLVVLFLPIATGCEDEPIDSPKSVCCDPNAEPTYLMSKWDDDDGDGIFLDEDFPTINDEDDDIADHAWIRDKAGVYHLFFHNEDHGSGNHIEHYTSTDLRSLEYVGVALFPNPDGWDSHGLWAPHIIESGDTYYMFYTGVDGLGPSASQRIGLATSIDLVTWTRYPVNNCPGTWGDGCVYDCDERWTTWGEPNESFNRQCRDPFVIWDSVHRRWVLFATAKSTNQFGVVTVAYSADMTSWDGAGYIDATRKLEGGVDGQPTGGQAENPHVMSHGGMQYLLFTDWDDPEDSVSVHDPRTIVQYATSPTLTADSLGSVHWTYRGYIPDPGVNALEVQHISRNVWIMSQSISNERSGLWHIRRQLRLRCVVWGEDFTFDTSNVDFFCGADQRERGPTGVGIFRDRIDDN